MKGRQKGVSVRLTLEEETRLRAFCADNKISLSEAMRLAVDRLNDQARQEQSVRQLKVIFDGIQQLAQDRIRDREALRRVSQLLIICLSHDNPALKENALSALVSAFPEMRE